MITTTARPADPPPPLANVEAEAALLGSILIDPYAIHEVRHLLTAQHFYRASHQLIYQAMLDLAEGGHAVDLVTVSNVLETRQQTDVAPLDYVTTLINATPMSMNAPHYARVVLRHWVSREAERIALGLISGAHRDATPEAIADTIQHLLALQTAHMRGDPLFTRQDALLDPFLGDLYDRHAGRRPTGVLTGFAQIDTWMGGLEPTNLLVVAARPKVGKSSFARGCAEGTARIFQAEYTAALAQGLPATPRTVFYLSMEMSAQEQIRRSLAGTAHMAQGARISTWQLRDGFRHDPYAQQWLQVIDDAAATQRATFAKHLYLGDTVLTMKQLEIEVARAVEQDGLSMLWIDQASNFSDEARSDYERMTHIVRGCKHLAQRYSIPIAIAAQISREGEKKTAYRATASDLKSTGAFEEFASYVLLLHRAEVWYPPLGINGAPPPALYPHFMEVIGALGRDTAPHRAMELQFINEACSVEEWPEHLFPSAEMRAYIADREAL